MSKKILYRDISQLRNKEPAEYTSVKEQKELSPLEALERIKNAPTIYVGCASDIYTRYSFECKKIEKSLKALEIIKNKQVYIRQFLMYKNNLAFYNAEMSESRKLTPEEFSILTEVLF